MPSASVRLFVENLHDCLCDFANTYEVRDEPDLPSRKDLVAVEYVSNCRASPEAPKTRADPLLAGSSHGSTDPRRLLLEVVVVLDMVFYFVFSFVVMAFAWHRSSFIVRWLWVLFLVRPRF